MSQFLEFLGALVVMGIALGGFVTYSNYRAVSNEVYDLQHDLNGFAEAWYMHAREYPTDSLGGLNIHDEVQFEKFKRFLGYQLDRTTAGGLAITRAEDLSPQYLGVNPFGEPYQLSQNGVELWVLTRIKGVTQMGRVERALRGMHIEVTAGTWQPESAYEPQPRDPLRPHQPNDANCSTYNPFEPRLRPIALADLNPCGHANDAAHDEDTDFVLAYKIEPPLKTLLAQRSKKLGDDYRREYEPTATGSEERVYNEGLQSPVTFTSDEQFNPNSDFGSAIAVGQPCNFPSITVDKWGIPFKCVFKTAQNRWEWESFVEPDCDIPMTCSVDRELRGERPQCRGVTAPATTATDCSAFDTAGRTLIYPNGIVGTGGRLQQPPTALTTVPAIVVELDEIVQASYEHAELLQDRGLCQWAGSLRRDSVYPAYDYRVIDAGGNVRWSGNHDCEPNSNPPEVNQAFGNPVSYTDADGVTHSIRLLYAGLRLQRVTARLGGTLGPINELPSRNPPTPTSYYAEASRFLSDRTAGLLASARADQPESTDPTNGSFAVNQMNSQYFTPLGSTPPVHEILVGLDRNTSDTDARLVFVRIGGPAQPPRNCPPPDSPLLQDPSARTDPVLSQCPFALSCQTQTPVYTAALPESRYASLYARAGAWDTTSTRDCSATSALAEAPAGACLVGAAAAPECCVAQTVAPAPVCPVSPLDCDDPGYTSAMSAAGCDCNPRCGCLNSVDAYLGVPGGSPDDDYTSDPSAVGDFTGQCWGKQVRMEIAEQRCDGGRTDLYVVQNMPRLDATRTSDFDLNVQCVQDSQPSCPIGYSYQGGTDWNDYTCEQAYFDPAAVNTALVPRPGSDDVRSMTSYGFTAQEGGSGAVVWTTPDGSVIRSSRVPSSSFRWCVATGQRSTGTCPLVTPRVIEWQLTANDWGVPTAWAYNCNGSGGGGGSEGDECRMSWRPYDEISLPFDSQTKGGQRPAGNAQPHNAWIYTRDHGYNLEGFHAGSLKPHSSVIDCPPYMESPGTGISCGVERIVANGKSRMPKTSRTSMPAARSALSPDPTFTSVNYTVPRTCRYKEPLRTWSDTTYCPTVTATSGVSQPTPVGSPAHDCDLAYQIPQSEGDLKAAIVPTACPSGFTLHSTIPHPDDPSVNVGGWCRKETAQTPIRSVQVNATLFCSGNPDSSGRVPCWYDDNSGTTVNVVTNVQTGSLTTLPYHPVVVQDTMRIQNPTPNRETSTAMFISNRFESAPGSTVSRADTFGCEIGMIDRGHFVCEQAIQEGQTRVCTDGDGDPTTTGDQVCDDNYNPRRSPVFPLWKVDAARDNPQHRFNIGTAE